LTGRKRVWRLFQVSLARWLPLGSMRQSEEACFNFTSTNCWSHDCAYLTNFTFFPSFTNLAHTHLSPIYYSQVFRRLFLSYFDSLVCATDQREQLQSLLEKAGPASGLARKTCVRRIQAPVLAW